MNKIICKHYLLYLLRRYNICVVAYQRGSLLLETKLAANGFIFQPLLNCLIS